LLESLKDLKFSYMDNCLDPNHSLIQIIFEVSSQ